MPMPKVSAMSSIVHRLGPSVAWRAKRCAIAMPMVPIEGVYQFCRLCIRCK